LALPNISFQHLPVFLNQFKLFALRAALGCAFEQRQEHFAGDEKLK
jgi:hypothetical protein